MFKNKKLLKAIKNNDPIEVIDSLVKSGANVNKIYNPDNRLYSDQYTALKLALDGNNLEITQYLADKTKSNINWHPNEFTRNNLFERYLFEAKMNLDVLSYILENHISFDDMLKTKIKYGDLPNQNILDYLFDIDKKENIDLMSSYIINNKDNKKFKKVKAGAFLEQLSIYNKFSDFKNIIECNETINVNEINFKEEKTFLMLAISNQNYKFVDFILNQQDLNLTAKDINGLTAYDIALNTDNQTIIQLLEEHGAKPNNKISPLKSPSEEWVVTADLEISRTQINNITGLSVTDSFNFHSKRIISSVSKNGNDNNSSQFIKYFDDLKNLDFVYEAKEIYEEKTGNKINWGNCKDKAKTKFPKGTIK